MPAPVRATSFCFIVYDLTPALSEGEGGVMQEKMLAVAPNKSYDLTLCRGFIYRVNILMNSV